MVLEKEHREPDTSLAAEQNLQKKLRAQEMR